MKDVHKILIGLLFLYVIHQIYKKCFCREGLEEKTQNALIAIGVGVFVLILGSYVMMRNSF